MQIYFKEMTISRHDVLLLNCTIRLIMRDRVTWNFAGEVEKLYLSS